MGEENYVPFMNVLPDDEKYQEDMPDDICLGNTANRNLFQQRAAQGVPLISGNNKRKRESEIMLDYERVSTTKRKRID